MLSQRPGSFLRATQLGLVGILDALLDAGVDVENQGNRSKGLLHEACESENMTIARVLLERGVDPNEIGAKDDTPLMVAARHGNDAIARLLFEYNAGIEAEDRDWDSALHTAAYYGSEGVARALLEMEARPTVCGGSGYTPMQLALNRGQFHLAKLLLE
ncbi:ankyrin repeat-containing domain protein, partial [Paraphoma chrysanthemicola]